MVTHQEMHFDIIVCESDSSASKLSFYFPQERTALLMTLFNLTHLLHFISYSSMYLHHPSCHCLMANSTFLWWNYYHTVTSFTVDEDHLTFMLSSCVLSNTSDVSASQIQPWMLLSPPMSTCGVLRPCCVWYTSVCLLSPFTWCTSLMQEQPLCVCVLKQRLQSSRSVTSDHSSVNLLRGNAGISLWNCIRNSSLWCFVSHILTRQIKTPSLFLFMCV